MVQPLNVAFVQDALPFKGGAEKVLAAALEVFPEAPIYTLVFNKKAFENTRFEKHKIITSFMDRLPGAHNNHRIFLPVMPLAIEQFDLSQYQVVVSFSYAVAHGVLVRPDQLHISYTHSILRYAWQSYHRYMGSSGSLAKRLILHYLRIWDMASANRVDHFVANSAWMAQAIWRTYHRRADVIYPPVDVERFVPELRRGNYYICTSRLVAHKRVDLVVEAFSRLGLPLLVVGQGPEYSAIKKLAAPNVKMLGWQEDIELSGLLDKAKAFVHAGEEDFGIAMVEAQAAGCPVITLDGGASREIIIENKTGLFFREQTVDSIIEAVKTFENGQIELEPAAIISRNAVQFNKERFQRKFANLVTKDLERFVNRDKRNIGKDIVKSNRSLTKRKV
jgi:glycosyltransferase involved in cell wall biosynthesis